MHAENNYAKQKLMTHLDQKRSPISYTKQDKYIKDPNSHLTLLFEALKTNGVVLNGVLFNEIKLYLT